MFIVFCLNKNAFFNNAGGISDKHTLKHTHTHTHRDISFFAHKNVSHKQSSNFIKYGVLWLCVAAVRLPQD
jgi:hypothetical protein